MQLSGFLRPRHDMDDKELALWAFSLGADHDERIKVLEDLLTNAKADQMSDEDQQIVRGVLAVTREQSYRAAPHTKKVVAPHPADTDGEADDYRFI